MENSFGIIPLRLYEGEWQTLLVRHGHGHWAFPKGHALKHETPQETAIRELREETGLEIASFFDYSPFQENYTFSRGGKRVAKSVTYFIAEVSGKITVQVEEISDFKWVFLKDAEKRATFPETKKLCSLLLSLIPREMQ